MIIRLTSFIFRWELIKKWRMFKTLLSSKSLAAYLDKKLCHCGKNIRVFSPRFLLGLKYVSIGDNFKMGCDGIIAAWERHNNHNYSPQINIGDNVSFGYNCHIASINSVTIKSGVLGGSYILISDHAHGNFDELSIKIAPNDRELVSKGPIIIEENVWIGDKVTILPNVTVGRNSIIGANSVVTKSMPMNSVICGNPAKVIKKIDDEK